MNEVEQLRGQVKLLQAQMGTHMEALNEEWQEEQARVQRRMEMIQLELMKATALD